MGRRGYLLVYGVALALAWAVVVLGAYVRLSDAGLGCPDWPGCYGRLTAPRASEDVAQASEAFPQRSVSPEKAWKEMLHRYAAGGLGVLLLVGAVGAWRRTDPRLPVAIPACLLFLVVFQALLGMWTVTLLLKPLVVVAHLLGGMTILALVAWCVLRAAGADRVAGAAKRGAAWGVGLAMAVLYAQLFLGGWTSANYAALACVDLPRCQGAWWPVMNFAEGFTLWRGLGVDYEFGVLDAPARTAVHMAHRLGAVITFLTIGTLALVAVVRGPRASRRIAALVLLLLLVQVSLGVLNVRLGLPLAVAVAHNGVAALLLLALVSWLHRSLRPAANAST